MGTLKLVPGGAHLVIGACLGSARGRLRRCKLGAGAMDQGIYTQIRPTSRLSTNFSVTASLSCQPEGS